jgi:ABC-type dipeptide/oligopeptide/nickel transport system permease component
LATKYKINKLDPQLDNWEDKLKTQGSISEAKSIRQKIEQKLQEEKLKRQPPVNTINKNKFPLSTKLAIGSGIILLIVAVIVITYQIIKNKKVKK